jgi:hypothetical protein
MKLRYLKSDIKGVIEEVGFFLKAWWRETRKQIGWLLEDISYRMGSWEMMEEGEPVHLEWRCALCNEVVERANRECMLEVVSSTQIMMGTIHKEKCLSWVIRWIEDGDRLFHNLKYENKHPQLSIPEYAWRDILNAWEKEQEFERDGGLQGSDN